MLTNEQLEIRKSGIGGSDAAAVLGLSKWNTPLQIYLKKKGLLEVEQNDAMYWGSKKEAVIREVYQEKTGYNVLIPEMIRHSKHNFMLANVDGIANGNRLLEIKTASYDDEWGESGSTTYPQDYYVQVQHYLAVTKLKIADLVVLIGSNDYRTYEIEADLEFQEMIIDGERKWWENFKNDIEPEPISYDDIIAKFGQISNAISKIADEDIKEKLHQLKLIKEKIKSLGLDEDLLKIEIMKYLGEADTLTYNNKVIATWKLAKASEIFDKESFKLAYPDIYLDYVKFGKSSRRFLIK